MVATIAVVRSSHKIGVTDLLHDKRSEMINPYELFKDSDLPSWRFVRTQARVRMKKRMQSEGWSYVIQSHRSSPHYQQTSGSDTSFDMCQIFLAIFVKWKSVSIKTRDLDSKRELCENITQDQNTIWPNISPCMTTNFLDLLCSFMSWIWRGRSTLSLLIQGCSSIVRNE